MKKLSTSKSIDWVRLAIGAIITALFIIFSNKFYELLYYNGEFSNEMYNEKLYTVVAIYTSSICWGMALLFYWIIDRLDRWFYWIISLFIVMALSPTVVYYYCDSVFRENNMDMLTIPLKNFDIINLAVTFVLYLIVCFSVKKLSRNCSTTPI